MHSGLACLIGVRVGARADSQNAAFHTIEDKARSRLSFPLTCSEVATAS